LAAEVKRTKSRITDERIEAYKKAFELRKQGLGPIRISRMIGVPWPTIGHWFYQGYHPLGATNRFDAEPSPEFAYVIGAVLGDGYTHYNRSSQSYSVILEVKDKEFAEAFSRNVSLLLRKEKAYKVQETTRGTYRVEAYSYELFQFLKKPLNELRSFIQYYPKDFLHGFYDAEGSACLCYGRLTKISLCNTNKQLLLLSKQLLEQMGFHPAVYGYDLVLHGKEKMKRFFKEIGFSASRWQERSKLLEVD